MLIQFRRATMDKDPAMAIAGAVHFDVGAVVGIGVTQLALSLFPSCGAAPLVDS